MKSQRYTLLLLPSLAAPLSAAVSFEELALPGAQSHHQTAPFSSGGLGFNNTYTDFGGGFDAYFGWSYSNHTDTTTPGYTNQYSAFPGGGSTPIGIVATGEKFAVAYAFAPNEAYITLPAGRSIASLKLTNTTFAALTIRDGDSLFNIDRFGGADGLRGDYFQVIFTAFSTLDATGVAVGTPVEFVLADYRFADSAEDYIVDEWTNLDLSSLAGASSIGVSFFSTDVGSFGINTPTYVAIDQIVVVPEPTSIASVLIAGTTMLRRRRGEAR